MTDTLQFRRGTTAKTAAFTGLTGEITVDTDKKVAVVHDGSKAGGYALLRDDLSNLGPVKADIVPDTDNVRSLGSPTKRWKDIYIGQNTIHIGDSTSFSGTSLVIDAGTNPTALSQMPTLLASKLVAKPFQYNPGSGAITVRPSIEFQDTLGNSYPISFNTVTKEFSLDADGNHGEGLLVAKKATLSGDLLGTGTTAAFRWDGNTTLGYDASNTITLKGTASFVGPSTFQGAVTLGDGNDTVTINAGASNPLNVTSSTLSVNGTGVTVAGALVVDGNLTVNGTTTTIHSTTVNVGDNILVLNADITGGTDPSLDAGIQVARGTQAAVKWVWDEANDYWSPAGANLGNIGTLTAGTINVTTLNATGLNAATAAKLTTARNITLTGSVAGTASFDGSSDITITTTGGTGGGVNNVAGSMMVMVSEQIVTSSTQTITITGLDGDNDVEYEIRGYIVNGSGLANDYIALQMNGDSTTANYVQRRLYGDNTTTAADGYVGSGLYLGFGDAGQWTTFNAQINAASGRTRTFNNTTSWRNSATGIQDVAVVEGQWLNTSANITSLVVTASNANGIGAGSRFAVYARKKVGGSTTNVSASYRGALTNRTAQQTGIAAGTWTPISWQVSQYDSDGFWSAGNPTRFTVPAGVNKVRISAQAHLANAGTNYVSILKNGTDFVGETDVLGAANNQRAGNVVTGVVPVVAGDYFVVQVYSSVANSTSTNLNVTWANIEVLDPVPVAVSGFGSNTTTDYAFLTLATTLGALGANTRITFDTGTGNMPLTNGQVTLKAGKTYRLNAHLLMAASTANAVMDYQWYSVTAGAFIGTAAVSRSPTSTYTHTNDGEAMAVLTPMVDTTVELRTVASASGIANVYTGYSFATIEQIAGPANGLNYGPAGYASLKMSASTPPASNANFAFDSLTGNLTLNGNGVVLKAGRVYMLQAGIWCSFSAATGVFDFGLHDGTNYIGSKAEIYPVNSAGVYGQNPVATAIYRPGVDTTVTLKAINATSVASLDVAFSYFNVIELASTVDTYSTTETLTGKIWIDGKPIYRKVVSCGTLPNNTQKTVAHGITGITEIITTSGFAKNGTVRIPLPFPYNTNSSATVWADSTNVQILTVSDYSAYTTTYVTLEYTK